MNHDGLKLSWSLRDDPVTLTIMVIGILIVMLTLGWITVRIGSLWIQNYIHQQTQSGE